MISGIDFAMASRAHWGEFAMASRAHWGERYSQQNPGRYTHGSGFKDCSGHVACTYRDVTGELPRLASGTFALVSVYLYVLCRDEGSLVPWDAPFHPGELLFMPDDPTQGWGNKGHVCMIDVNPLMTSEARGTAYGVGSWTIDSRRWARQRGRLPGIDFGPSGPTERSLEKEALVLWG